MEPQLGGETAIVTGAGAGIGRAVALRLAEAGALVALAERDAEAAAAVAAEVAAAGGRAIEAVVDISDLEAVAAMVRTVEERGDGIDILVNNAAVTRSSTFFEVTPEEWDTILATNARGLFFCMQEVARLMTDRGCGRIVNVASIAGKGWGGSSSAAYAASKGAILALTRYAAGALAPSGIAVNTVCPGLTMTTIFERVVRERAEAAGVPFDRFLDEYAAQVPLRLVNEPADVAEAVAFLASPQARTITGQSLNVDGGLVFD